MASVNKLVVLISIRIESAISRSRGAKGDFWPVALQQEQKDDYSIGIEFIFPLLDDIDAE
jgi:hypothetical protein